MPDSTGDRKLLLFKAGPVACCTDGISVFRIIDPPEHLVRLPGTSGHPLIFKLDNRLVRVVDVRALFGLDQQESANVQSKLIVAEVSGELTGFWVDQVSFMISVSQGQWSPLPSVVPRSLFDAAFRYEDQLILHVDFNRMASASPTVWVYESGLYAAAEESPPGDEDEHDSASSVPQTGDQADQVSVEEVSPPVMAPLQGKRPETTMKPASQPEPRIDRRPVPVIEAGAIHEAHRPQAVSHASQKPVRPAAVESPSEDNVHEAESESYDSGQGTVWVWGLLLGAFVLLALFVISFWPESESRVATTGNVAVVSSGPAIKREEVLENSEYEETIPEPVPELASQPRIDQPEETILDSTPETMMAEPGAEEALPADESSSIQRQGNTVVITLPVEAELIEQGPEARQLPTDGEPLVVTGPGNLASLPEQDAVPESQSLGEIAQQVQEVDMPEEPTGVPVRQEMEVETPVEIPAQPEPIIIEEVSHIVVKGDTLWAIAKRYINDPFRYPELARLSKIKNPDLIYPGDRVLIRIEQRP